jgi:hypothetical protein
MLEQLEARTGVRPTELLVDGGYPNHDAIDQATAAGVTVSAPVPKPRSKPSEKRAATAETVNADAKAHRGMAATALRGLDKVTGIACLFALTYNILRFIAVNA